MSAAVGHAGSSRGATTAVARPGQGRSLSTRSIGRQQSLNQGGGGYTADNDNDDDDEGDYDGEDGDEDDEDQVIGGEGLGGKDLLNETTLKSGYLWKRGEKRKVSVDEKASTSCVVPYK
jgi:hypothetical protein